MGQVQGSRAAEDRGATTHRRSASRNGETHWNSNTRCCSKDSSEIGRRPRACAAIGSLGRRAVLFAGAISPTVKCCRAPPCTCNAQQFAAHATPSFFPARWGQPPWSRPSKSDSPAVRGKREANRPGHCRIRIAGAVFCGASPDARQTFPIHSRRRKLLCRVESSDGADEMSRDALAPFRAGASPWPVI